MKKIQSNQVKPNEITAKTHLKTEKRSAIKRTKLIKSNKESRSKSGKIKSNPIT